MLRTRLFWFSAGFGLTAASISQFAWKDLLAYRCALFSEANMELKFDALDARVSNLESVRCQNSIPSDELAAHTSL